MQNWKKGGTKGREEKDKVRVAENERGGRREVQKIYMKEKCEMQTNTKRGEYRKKKKM